MNIYVTPALRNRMHRYNAVINWSQVAAAAFEHAIVEHDKLVARRIRRVRMAHKWMEGVHGTPINRAE